MTQPSIPAAILALASLPLVASAAPGTSFRGQPQAPLAEAHPDSVLYSQEGTDSGIGIVSQNFESSLDAYDAQAADDFVVPKGRTWVVQEVDVIGVYFNGTGLARDENLTIYRNSQGKPGKVVFTATLDGADNGTGRIDMKIFPPRPPHLVAARYWVSVQANMDFSVGGEWGWENQTTVQGLPAVWQNPGGGFGVGCTTYTTETTCIPDGQGDHMFVIKGKSN
jgi:hypothetical protein